MKLRLPELILLQLIIYITIYLMSSYIGIMVCLVMAPIFFFVLMISLLAEAFERSRISKTYFAFMISGCLVPLAVLLFVVVLDPSALKWLE